MKKVLFLLILLILSAISYSIPDKSFSLSNPNGFDYYLNYYFYSNDGANINYEIAFRLVGDTGGNEKYSPTWYEWNNENCSGLGSGNQCAHGFVWDGDAPRIDNPGKFDPPVTMQWGTGCIDPYPPVAQSSCSQAGQYCTLFAGYQDITCNSSNNCSQAHIAGINYYANRGGYTVYFGGFRNTNNCPTVPCNPRSCGSACGSISDGCGGTLNCGGCGSNYCDGDTPRPNCELVNPDCNNNTNACVFNDRTTYAAACDDPDGPNDGASNRCAPPAPNGLADTPFCQGTAGTDRAAGIEFEWNPTLFDTGYDFQYKQTTSSNWIDLTEGVFRSPNDGKIHKRIPGSGCDTGPGGCSLPYDTQFEWRVRGNTESGRSGPTDWSNIHTVTTSDCGGKPDLRITACNFPGGNSDGTSHATVTINNNGYKGTGTGFRVRVNNGVGNNPDVAFLDTGALAEDGSRTLTIPIASDPGLDRPNAGSYTGVAVVDSLGAISEADESNNDRNCPYRTTSHVSGIIFVDSVNRNGVRDPGEPLYTGGTVTVRVAGVDYPTSDGSYQSAELDAGTYNVNLLNMPSGYTRTAPSTLPVSVTLGPNRVVNFGIVQNTSTITAHVYKDLGDPGVEGAGDDPYPGATITVTGNGARTRNTDADGNVIISNLNPGTSTIALTVPPGWTLTTPPNPKIRSVPPSQVVNFGIQPPVPRCDGGMTATPSTVSPGPGVFSTLRCVTPISPSGDRLTYTWYPGTVGTVTPGTTTSPTNTTRWNSPAVTLATSTNPSVQVCYQGTLLCSSYGTTITLTPRFKISGNVFVDDNKDGIKNGAETNYTGNVNITATPVNGSFPSYAGGAYTINDVPTGTTYAITYANGPPLGYEMTYPPSVGAPSFSVRVGANCRVGGHNSATCVLGNIINLNFGITNSVAWIQSQGSNVWFNSGINNPVPAGASCQSYMSYDGAGGTPGVMYSGTGSYDFGLGDASRLNWVVGGNAYPEPYTPSTPGIIKTSYAYISSLAAQNNITPIDMASVCGSGGLTSCTLPANLANGVYKANSRLVINNASYSFPPDKDFVIMVAGNLRFNGTIDVPTTSTVLFTARDDIHVSSSVGTTNQLSTAANLEGWFSADHSFYVDGAAVCPTADRRLNVEGAVVINASLKGGSFVNNRDLCNGNLQCPVFHVKERPDFTLNAPRFLQTSKRIYQELAP